MSDFDKADKLGRKRARIWFVAGLMLPALQVLYLDQPDGSPPAPHQMFLWTFLVITMLFALMTGGGFGYGRKVRAMVNDETARANRDVAVRAGFAAAILTGLAIYLAAPHYHISGQLAAHIVTTTGLSSALLCFGTLEWRGHRLG